MEYKELIEQANYYTKKYNEGNPEISDAEWDKLYFKIAEIEKETQIYDVNSPTQRVNFTIVNQLNKVKHNHPMLSLDKTRDWNQFLSYFGDYSVIGMIKCDGLTCSLRYLDGKLVSAETRGDGFEGEDVLHNILTIKNVPKRINHQGELIVDGEIICDTLTFDDYFKGEYANARNFASGSIRLLNSQECAGRGLKFILWNVITGIEDDSFLQRLVKADELGFDVVPWTSSFDWDAKEFLVDSAKEEHIPIDGLVGRFDDIKYGESLGVTGHHSKAAFAFKFTEERYTTHLKDIEWTMGRTGALCPVAIFDEIDTGDSIISKASLHNVTILDKICGKPYIGQEIVVIKTHEIIPQIISAEKKDQGVNFIDIPHVCPYCGSHVAFKQDKDSIFLYCDNAACNGKLVNRLDHYCGKKGMDIKGLSELTIEKLVNCGWVEKLIDIYHLSKYRISWAQCDGFGEKSVQKILDSIRASENCELCDFISALGIPLIGSTISKDIARKVKTWEDFRQIKDFSSYEGIGDEINKSLLSFDYSEADEIANMFLTINNSLYIEGEIKNMFTVCITGKLTMFNKREDLVAAIEAKGGKVTSSVSAKTNILINNEINSNSSKNLTAKKLNIPIMTEQEFCSVYL